MPDICPPWEPEDFSDFDLILSQRMWGALEWLKILDKTKSHSIVKDTRLFHARYYRGLTPNKYGYYAGNYRGDTRFNCLRYRHVTIRGFQGSSPDRVEGHMQELAGEIEKAAAEFATLDTLPSVGFSDEDKLIRKTAVFAAIYTSFVAIHPYLNGNGHAARFIFAAFFLPYGYVPQRFPIHPNRDKKTLSDLITDYRNGNTEPLIRFFLSCLL